MKRRQPRSTRTDTRFPYTPLFRSHSAVADAVFAREPERKAIEAVAGDTGTTFTGIWLATEEERRVERVLARTSDASDADVIIARTQSAYAIGRLDGWVSIDASGAFERTLEAARLDRKSTRLNSSH